MRKLACWLGMALLLAAAPLANATTVTNGGFETGTLAGWTAVIGMASIKVVGSHDDPYAVGWGYTMGVTHWEPTKGSSFALLKTDGPGNWCQLWQDFTAIPGDVLSFDYFWDSQDFIDPAYIDTARGSITKLEPSPSFTFTLFAHSPPQDPESFYGTPWTSVSYTFTTAGSYRLIFEIANGGDDTYDSYLGVDNVKHMIIPEPLTAMGALAGLGALGGYLRRRRLSA